MQQTTVMKQPSVVATTVPAHSCRRPAMHHAFCGRGKEGVGKPAATFRRQTYEVCEAVSDEGKSLYELGAAHICE